MSAYQSKYTGERIDELLGLVETSAQKVDLDKFLTKLDAEKTYLKIIDGKGLSTQDFTTESKMKLENLLSQAELNRLIFDNINYFVVNYTGSVSETRNLSPERRYGIVLSYNTGSSDVTEKYIGSSVEDSEWVKDSNWTSVVITNTEMRPINPGIYVRDINGHYTLWDKWDSSNEKIVCLAIVTNNVWFGVSLVDCGYTKWSSDKTLVDGVVTTYDEVELRRDYFGFSNTEKIISTLGSNAIAAELCNNYIFKDGTRGYLPGIGELSVLHSMKSVLDKIFVHLGGEPMSEVFKYWSSTQCPESHAWWFNWANGEIDCLDKTFSLKVRAFYKI